MLPHQLSHSADLPTSLCSLTWDCVAAAARHRPAKQQGDRAAVVPPPPPLAPLRRPWCSAPLSGCGQGEGPLEWPHGAEQERGGPPAACSCGRAPLPRRRFHRRRRCWPPRRPASRLTCSCGRCQTALVRCASRSWTSESCFLFGPERAVRAAVHLHDGQQRDAELVQRVRDVQQVRSPRP